jgi:transcriptional regulator with XRE-family HTH domain
MMTALRKLRFYRGWQQKDVATELSIGNGYLCDLEKGLKKPSPELAARVAAFYGVAIAVAFPDGVAEKDCRRKFREIMAFEVEPAEERPRPPKRYYTRCPKCGVAAVGYTCYACGMGLEAEPSGPAPAPPGRHGHHHKYYPNAERGEARW